MDSLVDYGESSSDEAFEGESTEIASDYSCKAVTVSQQHADETQNVNKCQSDSESEKYGDITTENFFNVESEEEEDKNSPVQHSINCQISAPKDVDLPNSEFWKKRDKAQNWDQPEMIWKSYINPDMTVAPLQGPSKRPYEQNNIKPVTKYLNKRTKVELETLNKDEKAIAKPLSKSCFFVHHIVQPHLNRTHKCFIPKKRSDINGHDGIVNRIKWNDSQYSHLLLSVSMDRSVGVWNAFSSVSSNVQSFGHHEKAVRDVQWTSQGRQVLSCGYDKTARLFDVEKGMELQCFQHRDFVTCLECYPHNPNYFITGSLNCIYCWDQRTSSHPVKQFSNRESFGQVQSLQFVNESQEFFSCNDVVSRDSAHKNIMVWDFVSGVVLSNQVYHERYTCTRLKRNPFGGEILAQTQGDYIAIFSTIRPYKMNKCKRFEAHKVMGHNIGCDISPDGQYVVSGSADNRVYVYDYRTARVLRWLDGGGEICMDVAWHPHIPACLAASTASGSIKIWS